MTFQELENLIVKNNIPKDVKLLSDSGWECSDTEMDGVYYNEKENHIIFTQESDLRCKYEKYSDYRRITPLYIRHYEFKELKQSGELAQVLKENKSVIIEKF